MYENYSHKESFNWIDKTDKKAAVNNEIHEEKKNCSKNFNNFQKKSHDFQADFQQGDLTNKSEEHSSKGYQNAESPSSEVNF